MIKKIAIALVVAVAGAGAIAASMPRTWKVEQSVVIDAPPERIHPFVDDLKHWQEWSPWTKSLDPAVRHLFEGEPNGVGARWTWMGPKMGQGTIEIVESSPTTGITLVETIEAATPNARATIRYSAEGPGTRVTWTDEGTLPIVVGGLFRGTVEAQLSAFLSRGLEKLKATVEAAPPPRVFPVPRSLGVDAGAALDGGLAEPDAGS